MSAYEKALTKRVTTQLATAFAERGTFGDYPISEVRLHTRKGPPVKQPQLPKTPPGIVIVLETSDPRQRLAYIHVHASYGKLKLRTYLVKAWKKGWLLGPQRADRFTIPTQAMVAVHLGQPIPDAWVQQILERY